jgi:hypothetical protein
MIHQPPRQGRMDRIAKIRRLTKYPQIPASLISPWDKLNLISIIHTWTGTQSTYPDPTQILLDMDFWYPNPTRLGFEYPSGVYNLNRESEPKCYNLR